MGLTYKTPYQPERGVKGVYMNKKKIKERLFAAEFDLTDLDERVDNLCETVRSRLEALGGRIEKLEMEISVLGRMEKGLGKMMYFVRHGADAVKITRGNNPFVAEFTAEFLDDKDELCKGEFIEFEADGSVAKPVVSRGKYIEVWVETEGKGRDLKAVWAVNRKWGELTEVDLDLYLCAIGGSKAVQDGE